MTNRESSGSQGGSSPARRDKSRSPARSSLSPARRSRSPARRSCSPARSRGGRSCSQEWPCKSRFASGSDSDDESSDDPVEGERQSEAEGENKELADFIAKHKRMMSKDQDRDGAGKIQRAAEFSQI